MSNLPGQIRDSNGKDILADSNGSLLVNISGVNSKPFLIAMAEGEFAGHSRRTVVGYSTTLSITMEDVKEWAGGGNITWPAAAAYMKIASTSNNDYFGTTGAHVVEIHGLGSSYQQITEVLTLTGTTPVTTTNQFIRINNMHTHTIGSLKTSAGTLKLQSIDSLTTYSQISAGMNTSLQAHYTVPASMTGYCIGWSAGCSGNKPVRMTLRATTEWDAETLSSGFQAKDIAIVSAGTTALPFAVPLKLPSRTDIKVSGLAIGVGATEACAQIDMWIEPNS